MGTSGKGTAIVGFYLILGLVGEGIAPQEVHYV